MNLFEIVKYGVNCREAAGRYGVEVNHCGMALCPFHNDRHPSLYVADDHYYCFACGEHGDVIDFVGRLFQLSPYDAAQKLAVDFHLTPDKPPSAAALHAKRIRTEAQQLRENERLCFSVLSDYARVLRNWKVRYAPLTQDEPLHERFIEACRSLDQTEYYLDILCAGDSYERAEVIRQQMADGKLDRLRQRLEKIHKEETEDGYDTADVA
ncbi:MAG: CHC2 zinc finger domain-containing protein [Lawsonibacter sp.]